MNAPAAIAALPPFDLLTGHSVSIEKELKNIQFGVHYNRLKQTVDNNSVLPTSAPTALSYANTQLGLNGEWKLVSFLGIGGTLDFNFLHINRSYSTETNYYTKSHNLLATKFGSYRYYLHFQKSLNAYFAVSFRPYYQQSFNVVNFMQVNEALENTVTSSNPTREISKFDLTPQHWTNWGGIITLRMFLSSKE
jgi:hypothetical protein